MGTNSQYTTSETGGKEEEKFKNKRTHTPTQGFLGIPPGLDVRRCRHRSRDVGVEGVVWVRWRGEFNPTTSRLALNSMSSET